MYYCDEIENFNSVEAMSIVEEELIKHRGDKLLPEMRLFLAIMDSAAREQDLEYFASKTFAYHCYLLGLDSLELLEIIISKSLIKNRIRTNYNYKTINQESETIKKLYDEGESKNSLALRYNVSTQIIDKVLDGDYRPLIPFNGKLDDIIRDYEAGYSIGQLVMKYKLSTTTIYRAIATANKKINKNLTNSI